MRALFRVLRLYELLWLVTRDEHAPQHTMPRAPSFSPHTQAETSLGSCPTHGNVRNCRGLGRLVPELPVSEDGRLPWVSEVSSFVVLVFWDVLVLGITQCCVVFALAASDL